MRALQIVPAAIVKSESVIVCPVSVVTCLIGCTQTAVWLPAPRIKDNLTSTTPGSRPIESVIAERVANKSEISRLNTE